MPGTYDFGAFHLDADEHLLTREGRVIPLPPKAFDLLVDLVEHAGHLRSKKDLMDLLWPGTFVEEANLSYTASVIRRALGDDKDQPRYVETVPTKGYRFIAVVTRQALAAAPDAGLPAAGPPPAAATPVPLPAAGAPLTHAASLVPPRASDRRGAFFGGLALALALVMTAALAPWRARTSAVPVRSIAVLPLDDLSGRPDYFADGLTDEIIVEISRTAKLEKVINRRAAMAVKQSTLDNAQIGRALGVDALLIGSISRPADRVRVTLQLLRAADDRVLWAGRFERTPAELPALEHDLVRELLAAIYVQALPTVVGHRSRTVDPEAYDLYLQGLAAFAKYDGTNLTDAPGLFRRAIQRDPKLARAHASLALALTHATMAAVAPIQREETERAAAAALALDEGLGDAWAALGLVRDLYEWDWKRGGQAIDRAVTLSPNSALVRIVAAHHAGWIGWFDQSIAQARRAVALDAGSTAALGELFWALHFAGRDEEMLAIVPRVLAGPGDPLREGMRWFVNLHEARLGRADSVCARAPDTRPCGFAWARSGHAAEAKRIFQEACAGMDRRGRQADHDSFCLQLAAALGDREPLLGFLESLVSTRNFTVPFLRAPEWGGLLEHEPRYEALLQRVGLGE